MGGLVTIGAAVDNFAGLFHSAIDDVAENFISFFPLFETNMVVCSNIRPST